MKNDTRLSMRERCNLTNLMDMGLSISTIAKRLGGHRSTIYRELMRNGDDRAGYLPRRAQEKAQHRCYSKPNKLVVNSLCYNIGYGKIKIRLEPVHR